MRRINQTPQDSLELLLDTLCNIFGGIILITCLLALMTNRKTKTVEGQNRGAERRGELLEQRTLASTEELRRLKELEAKLKNAGDADLRKMAVERLALEKTLERLRSEKTDSTPDAKNMQEIPVLDPGQEIAELRSRVEQSRVKVAEASSEESAIKAKATELIAKIENIKEKIGTSEKARTQKLRFPKERVQSKNPWHIILCHGEVYPESLLDHERFKGLEFKKISDDSHSLTPIRSKGLNIAADKTEILTLLKQAAQDGHYASVIVYKDDSSFTTFRQLKELIFKAGLDYGLIVEPKDGAIFFSVSGTSPPPL